MFVCHVILCGYHDLVWVSCDRCHVILYGYRDLVYHDFAWVSCDLVWILCDLVWDHMMGIMWVACGACRDLVIL